MQYPKSDKYLRKGFEIVRRVVPATYGQMEKSDWRVFTDVHAFIQAGNDEGYPSPGMGDLMLLSRAQGSTLPPGPRCFSCATLTLINVSSLKEWADSVGAGVDDYTAATLVHEFHHRLDHDAPGSHAPGELAAFKAEIEFAKLLSGRDGALIARDAYRDMMNVYAGEYPGTS